MTRNRLLLLAGALIAVFLAGYVPPALKLRSLNDEIRTTRTALEDARLRDSAGLIYLEGNRKNFGLARDEAVRFFEALTRASSTAEPERKKALDDILALRPAVVTGLTTADPAVVETIQNLYAKTRAATRH